MQLNKDKPITEKQKKEGLNTDSIPIHSPNPLPLDEDEAAAPPPERTGSRKEAAYQIYRDLILENIEYDTLTQNPRIDREQLDEIVDILLETVCTNRKSIRVAGDDYPAELVKAKFLKLDSHHIHGMQFKGLGAPNKRFATQNKQMYITAGSLQAMRVTAGLRMRSSFWQSGSTLPLPDECVAQMM